MARAGFDRARERVDNLVDGAQERIGNLVDGAQEDLSNLRAEAEAGLAEAFDGIDEMRDGQESGDAVVVAEAAEADQDDPAEGVSEGPPEGYITLDEFVNRRREDFRILFNGFEVYYNEHRTTTWMIGGIFASIGILSNPGRDFSSGTLNSIVSLARIPYRFAAERPLAFSGLMVGFAALYMYIDEKRESGEIWVPENGEVLKRDLIAFMSERQDEIARVTGQVVDVEELDYALDYVCGIVPLSDLAIDVEEFAEAAADSVLDYADLSNEELIAYQNRLGLASFRLRLEGIFNPANYPDLHRIINEFENGFALDPVVETIEIDALAESLADFGIRINYDDRYVTWMIVDEDHQVEYGPFRLFVNPNLSADDEFEAARRFSVTDESPFSVGLDMLRNDSRLLLQELRNGAVLEVVGGDIFIGGITERYLLGPAEIWWDVITDIADGGDFEVMNLTLDYFDGALPVYILGTPLVLSSLIQRRFGQMFFRSMRVIAYPISVPIGAARFTFDNRYRARVANELFNRPILRNVFSDVVARTNRQVALYDLDRYLASKTYFGGHFNPNRVNELLERAQVQGRIQTDNYRQNWRGTRNLRRDVRREIQRLEREIALPPRGTTTSEVSRPPVVTSAAEVSRPMSRAQIDAHVGHAPDVERVPHGAHGRRGIFGLMQYLAMGAVAATPFVAAALNEDEPENLGLRPATRDNEDADLPEVIEVQHDSDDVPRSEVHIDEPPANTGFDIWDGVTPRRLEDIDHANPYSTLWAVYHPQEWGYDEGDEWDQVLDQAYLDFQAAERAESGEYNMTDMLDSPEIYAEHWEEFTNSLGRIMQRYDEVEEFFDPSTVMEMDRVRFLNQADEFGFMHQQAAQDVIELVEQNEELLRAHFVRIKRMNEADPENQLDYLIPISNGIEVRYDPERFTISVNYASLDDYREMLYDRYDQFDFFSMCEGLPVIGEAGNLLQERYDLIENYYEGINSILNDSSLGDDEREAELQRYTEYVRDEIDSIHGRISQYYTGANLAAYIAPVSGEIMDLRDVRNAVERGQWGRATESSVYFLIGSVGDLALGAGTAARAARFATKSERFAELFSRASRALGNASATSRVARFATETGHAFDRLSRHGFRIFIGALGLDVARMLMPSARLSREHIIY